MKVIFLRHGPAERMSASGRDFDRKLTPEGRDVVAASAAALALLEIEVGAIYASPLARAVETAEIVRAALKVDSGLFSIEALEPGGSWEEVSPGLKGLESVEALVLVGHLPSMSEMVAVALGGPRRELFKIKPGGMACVSFADPVALRGAELVWLLNPKQIERLSR